MDKIMISIPLDEYKALVCALDRIGTLERMFAKNNYVSTGDIKVVLGIEEEKENEHEAV